MAILQQLQPLPYAVPLVDPKTGYASLEFQRWWQALFQNSEFTQGEVETKANAGAVGDSGLTMASNRLLGRNDPGVGPIEELTLSQALDLIGSAAQGDILYRGAANWERLAAGTVGQFLKTNGAGADPEWAAGGSGGYGYEAAPTIPAVAGFTLQNAGTASMANSPSGRGIILTVPTVGTNIRFVRKNGAPPATPYNVTLRYRPITGYSATTIYHGCVILRNSTSGRILIAGDYNNTQHLFQRFTNYTTFSANVLGPSTIYALESQPWVRFRNDGANIIYQRSPDGENWQTYGTDTLAGFINAAGGTVNEVGFGIMMNGIGFTCEDLFQSFTAA